MLKPPTLQEVAPPPPPIESEVQKRVLEKIRSLAKGNGIKPDTIEIEKAEAQTFIFEAQSYVRLTPHFTSKTVPGKIDKGEAIGTPQAFEAALRNMTVETQRDPGKRKTILDIILKRPDKGYNARDQVIKLDALAKDYVSHEACPVCQQSGKSACGRCAGEGVMTCQNCHGRTSTMCPTCRGNGTVTVNGKTATCTKCRGKMRVQCAICQGRGKVKCKNCQGAGSIPCGSCKASGFISHLAHVELLGHLHFNYDRQGLPVELTKLIDAFYLRYIEKKDMELSVFTYDYQENEPAENIPIGYQVKIGYGDITFKFGKKKKVTATLLGQNGELIKADSFLDSLTAAGQADLEKAASGQGNVGETLRKAARFRMLREAIVYAAGRGQARQALSRLLAKYPVGISADKLLKFINQASAAMMVITKKPRLAGLSLGGVVFAGLSAGYYMFARNVVLAHLAGFKIDPKLAITGCDILLLLSGVGICVAASQAVAARALKTALHGLASPATIKSIMPKVGWTLWAAFAISAGLSMLFYYFIVLKK